MRAMPLAWLHSHVDPVVTWVLVLVVVLMLTVWPVVRWHVGRRVEPVVEVRWHRFACALQLVAFPALLTLPGVSAANLGLGVGRNRGWIAALGVTGGTIVVFGLVALVREYWRMLSPLLRFLAWNVVLETLCDVLYYLALPMFATTSALRMPVGYAATVVVVAYGLLNVVGGWRRALRWTGLAVLIVTVYLLSGSVLLPAALIGTAALMDMSSDLLAAATASAPSQRPAPPLVLVDEPVVVDASLASLGFRAPAVIVDSTDGPTPRPAR